MKTVKIFREVGKNTEQDVQNAITRLQNKMNAFIITLDDKKDSVSDVNITVTRSFLEQTTLGEFEEVIYGSLTYEE